MKGIIVAKNSENSVLLLSDGTFKTVKTSEGFEVGMVLLINDALRPRSYYWKKIAFMVASFLVVAFIGIGAFAWSTPVKFINIDINPSVELSVNYFERIISVNPLNEDGRKLAESVSVHTRRYESGIELVISAAQEMGYLNDEEDILISISASDPKRVEKAQNDIREKVSPSVEILTFDTHEREQSIQKGISPGKNNIIEKVAEIKTDVEKDELKEKPVKELMKIIKENQKNEQEEKNEADESNEEKDDNSAGGQDEKNEDNEGNDNSEESDEGDINGSNQGNENDDSDEPDERKDKSDNPDKESVKNGNQAKENNNSGKSDKENDKSSNNFLYRF